MIILFSISILFAIDIKEDLTPYIMPKQLTYTSLPDDYDKRIEEYFIFFSEYMAVQDPNASIDINAKKVFEFYNKQTTERFIKLVLSRWVLMNKYPFYLQEFQYINSSIPYEQRYNTQTNIFSNSLVNYYYKSKNDKSNKDKNILTENDFFAFRKYLFDERNINVQATQFLWLVCNIESYKIEKKGFFDFITLNLSVDYSLGGDLFQEKCISVYLSIIPDNGKKNVTIEDIGLNQKEKYLIPISRYGVYEIFPPNYEDFSHYTTSLSTIMQIDNNKISLSENEEIDDMENKWIFDRKRDLKSYIFNDKRKISIEYADKMITDYVKCKKRTKK